MPQTRTRSPEEIRASIEQNREQLGTSIEKLRVEVVRLTDWRAPLRKHQQQVMIGAGVAGFVLGGGIAALGALTIGRRRNKQVARLAGRQPLHGRNAGPAECRIGAWTHRRRFPLRAPRCETPRDTSRLR